MKVDLFIVRLNENVYSVVFFFSTNYSIK
uniref:Uncharacterized protein n=1 Tax=Rhizophora mucronata TaxID=61149 RepID=A0A2P2NV18_RHIMU